jgi:hypothetical protein
MANDILQENAAYAAMTITIASLASSTSGVGRQTTLVDNSTDKSPSATIRYKITQGTSPTGNRAVYFILLRGDGTSGKRDHQAGASDAAITIPVAEAAWTAYNKSSPSTGDILQGSFDVHHLGKEWGFALIHDTGVNLDSTAGNHYIEYSYHHPEVQ